MSYLSTVLPARVFSCCQVSKSKLSNVSSKIKSPGQYGPKTKFQLVPTQIYSLNTKPDGALVPLAVVNDFSHLELELAFPALTGPPPVTSNTAQITTNEGTPIVQAKHTLTSNRPHRSRFIAQLPRGWEQAAPQGDLLPKAIPKSFSDPRQVQLFFRQNCETRGNRDLVAV